METVAVYSERPVRTYGLKAEEGLYLITALCPPWRLTETSRALSEMESAPLVSFVGGRLTGRDFEFLACLPANQLERVTRALEQAGLKVNQPPRPVSAIHLQGPHFGDRYGIVSQALTGLGRQGVEPLAVAGVVHSVFLIVKPEEAQAALSGLADHFRGPE